MAVNHSERDLRERKLIKDLIELYKSFPALWDHKSEVYLNDRETVKAFSALLQRLRANCRDATMDQIKKKVYVLRNNFVKEYKKWISCKSLGMEYFSPLWYFNDFLFLRESVEFTEGSQRTAGQTERFFSTASPNNSSNLVFIREDEPDPLEFQDISSDPEIIKIDDDDEPMNDPLGGSPTPSPPEKVYQMSITPARDFFRSVEEINPKKMKMDKQPVLRCRLLHGASSTGDPDMITPDRQDKPANQPTDMSHPSVSLQSHTVQTSPSTTSPGIRPQTNLVTVTSQDNQVLRTSNTTTRTGISHPIVTFQSPMIQTSSSVASQGIRPQSVSQSTITAHLTPSTQPSSYIRVSIRDQNTDSLLKQRGSVVNIPLQLNQQQPVKSSNCPTAIAIMPPGKCSPSGVSSANSNQSLTEFDMFSSYVAAALKTLPFESAISAQTKIMQILMEEKTKAARTNSEK